MAKSDLTNIHTTNKVAKKVIFHNFHMSKKNMSIRKLDFSN